MRLEVIAKFAHYRGKDYPRSATFDVDEAEHNVASHIRLLKLLGKVREVPVGAPVGEVGGGAPVQAALELAPAVETAAVPSEPAPDPAPTEPPKAAAQPRKPPAGGKYSRRDLRAED